MIPNWEEIVATLRSYPDGVHRLRPPCLQDRIADVEQQLGKLPAVLSDMLKYFNGARLFNKCGEMIAIFGLTEIPPLPQLEWNADWTIDMFTPRWRASGATRQSDWAIAMMNYGGLILLNDNGLVKEFDTSLQVMTKQSMPFNIWINEVFLEGNEFIKEE